MPIPCSQFVRRAAALIPMLVMLVIALATPAAAQNPTAPPPLGTVIPLIGGGTVIPQVTPHSASVTASVGANSYVFTVRNGGTGPGIMTTNPTCSGAASACTASPTSFSLAAGASRTVTVNYTGSSAGGTGTVTLEVDDQSFTHYDIGYVTVTVPPPPPTYIVSVTPDGAAYSMAAGTSSYNFTVANTGTGNATYTLASSCAGMMSGCSAPASVYVPHGTSAPVGVSFSDATPGTTGTASLTASYGGYSDGGSLNVSVNNSYAVSVTPDNQSQVVSPSSYVTFYVQNLGSIQTSFNLSVNCGCSLSASTITVNPGPASGVQVTVSLNGYAGTVVLTASDPAHGTSDTGSIIVSAPTYTVSASPDTNPQTVAQPIDANKPGSQTFYIYNMGNSPATYAISVSCPPNFFSNCNSATSLQVPTGATLPLPVSFTAAPPGGVGTMTLTASAQNTSDVATARWQVNTHYVSVAKGDTTTVYAGTGLTRLIGVTNNGNVSNSYTLTASCSGTGVSGCSAPASVSNIPVGNTQQVTVTYTGADAGGAGVVKLVARNTVDTGIADSGTVSVTVKPKYTVAVTPDGGTAQADAWTMASVPFLITNNGTARGRYTLFPDCTGTALHSSCTLDSTSVTVTNQQATQVKVSFLAGAPKGAASIHILAKSADDTSFHDTGIVILTVTTYAVSVTPDSQAVAPAAYASYTQPFVVTNKGSTQRTFNLQVACAPPSVTVCSSGTTALTLAPLDSAAVNVSYTAGDPGSTGTLRLVATDTTGIGSTDGGTLAVTVSTSVANNQVQFKQINPGTTIERSACLAFSIVPDVADECGALRIVHPLPGVTTLGKARVPTLIYSSDQLQGPTLAVNVILADTTTIPQSVQLAVVRTWPDAHRDTLTRVYPGTDWQGQANRRRRIAVPNLASGGIGILRYSVSVSLVYAGATKLAAPVDNSELAFVDRTNSAFGAGWWLAGLEQLFPGQYDGSVLWVAGDGSTRKYVKQQRAPSDTASDSVYLAAAFDRPDTLLHRSDGKYRRQAGNGLYVEFDGLGLHKRTVNRLGYETDFKYDGNNHLDTLQLPPWQGSTPAFTYTFTYNPTSQLLDAVTAPRVNQQDRRVTLTRLGVTRGVQTITELLDSTYSVGFEFPAGGALTYAARLDRRNVRTSFAYEDSSRTISSFATATGTGADTVRHTFRTMSAVGAAGASANLDTVYFRYDGPRPAAVGDTTLFWLDRFGGPTRIVDAMGHETRIARGDSRFPGLATEVRGPGPKHFTTWAAYDVRGNLRTSTQVNPHGDTIAIDATTTYLWHPKWDMDTLIVQPEGEITHIGYDPNGNRSYQEDGRGLMSRVSFQYYTTTDRASGAMAGLLSTVTLPATAALTSATTQIRYDSLGNVNTSITPLGFWSRTTNDAIGRTVQRGDQISAADSSTTTLTYDLSDRVTRSVSYGPAMNGAGAQSAIVDNAYDHEGRLTRVTRTQTPDTSRVFGQTYPALGSLVSRYQYDNLGRKLAEFAPDSTASDSTDNPVDYSFYDLAGNVITVQTRRNDHVLQGDVNHVIQMTYDVLNRLKTRTVPEAKYTARFDGYAKSNQSNPADQRNAPYPRFPNNPYPDTAAHNYLYYTTWGGYTVSGNVATFEYDEAGNMTVADNMDARVRRQYYPNGQVHLDSLYTKTLERDTVHKYGLEYLYDRDGRQTTLKHPVQLSPAPGFVTRSVYDSITGTLSKVTDPFGNAFTYGSDERNQTISLAMPYNFNERYGYDQDGDQLTQWSGGTAGALHDVTMTYDPRGKMLTLRNAVAGHDSVTLRYSGLGNLIYSDNIKWLRSDGLTRQRTTESFTYDPLGNRLHSDFADTTEDQQTNCGFWLPCHSSYNTNLLHSDWYYRTGTGRLVFDNHDTNVGKVTKYDESGNTVFSDQQPNVSNPTSFEDRASYYGADGMLAAVDFRQITDIGSGWKIAFDEYRYDALGRRVFVRSRRLCGLNYPVECTQSYVRRTIWAGSQELYEIQMPDTAILREYDTQALPPRAADANGYDPNPMYGRVAYTFGLKLDQPLTVIRLGYMNQWSETWNPFSIVPLWTVRGTADTSYFAATGATNCNTSHCVLVGYSSEYWTPAYSRYFVPTMFQGTLLSDKSDHTGQLYRRNRYYDPASGRFTQEDPIGLAGGLNAYGFAGGDPVSYSDPFGLCKNAKGQDASDSECAEKLRIAQDAAMRCPAFQPGPGTTHCNQATLNVASDMGAPLGPLTDSNGGALTANEIAANLAKPGSGYREVTGADGQALANKGVLVIAALAAGGHGHVATLRPNPSGGKWPLVANVGPKNAVMGLNYAWPKGERERVKFYTPEP